MYRLKQGSHRGLLETMTLAGWSHLEHGGAIVKRQVCYLTEPSPLLCKSVMSERKILLALSTRTGVRHLLAAIIRLEGLVRYGGRAVTALHLKRAG